MKQLAFFLTLLFLIVQSGCSSNTNSEKGTESQLVQRAETSTIKNIKEEDGYNVVLTKNYKINPERSEIIFQGHLQGDTLKKIVATVDYKHNFKVKDVTANFE